MRILLGAAALLCLVLCILFPLMHFLGVLEEAAFKQGLAMSSLGWFLFRAGKGQPEATRN